MYDIPSNYLLDLTYSSRDIKISTLFYPTPIPDLVRLRNINYEHIQKFNFNGYKDLLK